MRSPHVNSRLRWQMDVRGEARAHGYRFLVAGAADGAVWLDSSGPPKAAEQPPAPPKRKSPSSSSASSAGSATTKTLPMVAVEGRFVVELFGARSVIKADMFGKSDPYAVLKLGNQTAKTKTINNSQVSESLCFKQTFKMLAGNNPMRPKMAAIC
jgi:hypothetical protein